MGPKMNSLMNSALCATCEASPALHACIVEAAAGQLLDRWHRFNAADFERDREAADAAAVERDHFERLVGAQTASSLPGVATQLLLAVDLARAALGADASAEVRLILQGQQAILRRALDGLTALTGAETTLAGLATIYDPPGRV